MKNFINYLDNYNNFFWEKISINTYVPQKSLSVFRIMAGFFLLSTYIPSFNWIGSVPQTFFYPPMLSLANLFDQFISKDLFLILDILILICLIFIIVGVRASIFSFCYILLCLFGLQFKYSFGKIDHGIFQYVLIGCMAFSGWGSSLAIIPDEIPSKERVAKGLSLLGFLICFGMFTAGFGKSFVWLDFDSSQNGFLAWSNFAIFLESRTYLLAPYVKYIPIFLLEVFDYSAVAFEMLPLFFLLYSRKSWRFWLLIASTFHLANIILLNVSFTIHFIVYLAFIDFSLRHSKIESLISVFKVKLFAFGSLGLIVIIRLFMIFDHGLIINFIDPRREILFSLYFVIIIWLIAIAIFIYSILEDSEQIKLEFNNTN